MLFQDNVSDNKRVMVRLDFNIYALDKNFLPSTPIETKKPFLKDPDGEDVDVHIYRYLKGKPHLGLWYPKDSPFNMVAYFDSDYAKASLDRKSTIGGCKFLGCRLISWQSKNQTVVATSLTEAEYIAAASCCAQVLWIQNQLLDYGHFITAVSYKLLLFGLMKDADVHLMLLDDADGVECLPNEEIFAKLARMGYEKPPPKLTFYKAFFFAQWKFLFHTLVQCVSAKRTARNEFSCSMVFAIICLAIDDLSSHTTRYTYPALTQKVFANMRRVRKGFLGVETPLFVSMLVQPQAAEVKEEVEVPRGKIAKIIDDEDITLVDMETQVDMDDELQGRINDDNAATKDVNAAEPTVFDDEEVTMTMAQTLIKMKAEKARLLDEQMAKRLHDEDVEQAAAREKQEKDDLERAKVLQQQKYQSFKRKPISIAQARKNMIIYLKNIAGYKMEHFRGMIYDKKKRVAEETLLQESFKKLKAVEVSGSKSTQDTPTNDLKEMSEEDVQNMLEIIQYLNLKLMPYRSKKNYPLSNGVMTLMLSAKLPVKEDSDMARDLVMKIFMETNKPKSKSLDTSSK
nr:hypothetical protein [Tanacetum cinerariifolium]